MREEGQIRAWRSRFVHRGWAKLFALLLLCDIHRSVAIHTSSRTRQGKLLEGNENDPSHIRAFYEGNDYRASSRCSSRNYTIDDTLTTLRAWSHC